MTCQSLLPFQPSSVRQHRGRFLGSKISKIKNRDKFYTVEFRIDYIFIDTRISCGIIKNVKSILNVVLN